MRCTLRRLRMKLLCILALLMTAPLLSPPAQAGDSTVAVTTNSGTTYQLDFDSFTFAKSGNRFPDIHIAKSDDCANIQVTRKNTSSLSVGATDRKCRCERPTHLISVTTKTGASFEGVMSDNACGSWGIAGKDVGTGSNVSFSAGDISSITFP